MNVLGFKGLSPDYIFRERMNLPPEIENGELFQLWVDWNYIQY